MQYEKAVLIVKNEIETRTKNINNLCHNGSICNVYGDKTIKIRTIIWRAVFNLAKYETFKEKPRSNEIMRRDITKNSRPINKITQKK